MLDGGVDVLVVTALALERQAVRIHLTDVEPLPVGGLTADLGVVEAENGSLVRLAGRNRPWERTVAMATSQDPCR
jgi:hypothetical protein